MQRLFTLLFIFITLGVWILLTSPYNSFPDEESHFKYARFLRDYHRLPPLSLSAKPIPTNEGFQPPLYYLVAAFLLFPDVTENTQIILLRCFSLFLGMLTVVVLWKSALLVFKGNTNLAFLAASFTAFNPQFLFTHGGISNIAMTSFTANLAVLLMARISVLKRLTAPMVLSLGFVCGCSLLSRTITIYLLPVAVLVILYVSRQSTRPEKVFLESCFLFFLATLAVSGWWLIRNWIDYSDPFLWKIHQTTMGASWVRSEPLDVIFIVRTLAFLHASYWAYFGRNEFHAGIPEYALFLLLEVLAVIGIWEIFAKKRNVQTEYLSWAPFAVFVFSSLVAFGEILVLQLTISSPQGRYLYMSAAGNSIILGAGLLQITPVKHRQLLLKTVPLFMLASCLYLLIRYWYPHY